MKRELPPLEQIESIFHEALALPASDRRAFMNRACAGNSHLLRELESLLQYNGEPTEAFAAAVQPLVRDLLSSRSLSEALEPGAMLGPYRIETKIGEGGMGAVYLASDTRLGRKVAVKIITGAMARDRGEEARARFLREARSAAALCHPNIAALYDLGETDQTLWLVMEYVNGASLRSRLAGPLGESAWLRYASEIAAAMEHAHSRGIVHRDLKPENILITEDDRVKVIDLGLARAISGPPDGSGQVTASNAFIGTIAYAAPELLSGGAASAQSDVYSLGVLFYEMACGEQPFARLTGQALLSAIVSGGYRRCAERNPGLSRGAAAIIERCMSRDRATRYKDARELAADLRNVDTAAAFLQPDITPPTLAIMDFTNIGGPANLEWVGTGIAETLSADLAKVKSVRVASRSRVMETQRRLGATAIELGRDLGARWVVTGGYQRIGNHIRVTTTLIDSRTGDSLAAEKIDGRWADIFDVQDRVVAALLKALTIGFATTDRERIMPVETRNLVAWEHYVQGRQHLYAMDAKSLAAAIHHFEQAIALDPDYALAWSGLGTAHALQFIGTTDPEDIARASRSLERAIEIDPELGEPYPWLNNIRLRRNDLAGALEAGRKAVELQPDLPIAHYFYGGTCYMLPEHDPGRMRSGCAHVAEAIRIERRHHASWLVLGALAAFFGNHAEAISILREAVRMEAEADLVYRFVGARTLLAFAHMRSGDWDAAHAQHLDALEALRDTPHIYTSCFQTLSTCGLGDVELRRGNGSAALTHYRRARRVIAESRRILGSARLLIRANAGLAAAYAATGETARAIELTDEAAAQLRDGLQPATLTFECSLAQLHICLAVAEVRVGRLEIAAASVARACELGWLDWRWLETDPEFNPIRANPVFVSSLEKLASAPVFEFPMPQIGARAAGQSPSGTA